MFRNRRVFDSSFSSWLTCYYALCDVLSGFLGPLCSLGKNDYIYFWFYEALFSFMVLFFLLIK